MNEHAQKLVEALRSGEFEQMLSRLRATQDGQPSYCCLGVACEIYRRETGEGAWNDNDDFVIDGSDHSSFLPTAVREWLSFSTTDGYMAITLENGGSFSSLTELNDEAELSFAEIADVIESEPEGLFR